MKKLFVLIIISVATFSVINGQFTKVGGGLGYSSAYQFHDMPGTAFKSGHFIIAMKGIYQVSLPIQISPSFTYLVPHITKEIQPEGTQTTTISTIMFDINGHYIFNTPDRFEFYGLAGLDILLVWEKEVYNYSPNLPATIESDNALGLNIGAGTYMKITEQISLYEELKYIVSNYDQLMLNAGVLINLGGQKKNGNPGK
jgi:opacity protein-like surface antigen